LLPASFRRRVIAPFHTPHAARQVFAKMRNWTANNRQTGVGAALKKHYANLLWEYEQVA
jgi:hypothetical protein